MSTMSFTVQIKQEGSEYDPDNFMSGINGLPQVATCHNCGAIQPPHGYVLGPAQQIPPPAEFQGYYASDHSEYLGTANFEPGTDTPRLFHNDYDSRELQPAELWNPYRPLTPETPQLRAQNDAQDLDDVDPFFLPPALLPSSLLWADSPQGHHDLALPRTPEHTPAYSRSMTHGLPIVPPFQLELLPPGPVKERNPSISPEPESREASPLPWPHGLPTPACSDLELDSARQKRTGTALVLEGLPSSRAIVKRRRDGEELEERDRKRVKIEAEVV
ncbi:hypothetical protein DL546_004870 [Coniochaeta pulveracea]|uniref:Uncharacterized protein n=1 Tax=Coniochaeta pulveracea TaxID=177199 RepID=A0A420Y5M4_9PEZI|nr:hypothetical protein DL546_004870 [Coniochaeta pulveracea]